MSISRVSRVKVLWISGIFLIIGLATVLLIWQLHLAYLRKSLVNDLLTNSNCTAPCWQGIVPGETSRSQALEILRENSYVLRDSLREATTGDKGGVVWQWKVPGRRLPPKLSWQDNIVQEITLGLTHDLTIEQVVDKFGPPEALNAVVGGTPEHWYWIVELYYPNSGIQFQTYTSEFSTVLEPSTQVEVVHFFAPTSLEKRVINVFGQDPVSAQHIVPFVMSSIRPWRGYGDLFEVYYESPQDLELGK